MSASQPPNPTWADIKQLCWAALLVVPFIALGAFGAARLVGAHAAFWVGVWLTVLVLVTFTLIVSACLALSFGADLVEALRRRRRAAAHTSKHPPVAR